MSRGRALLPARVGRARPHERLLPASGGWAEAVLAAGLVFLALLAAATGLSAQRAASELRAGVAESATLAILAEEAELEAQARAALAVLREAPGVRGVRILEAAEQRALLAPWLGTGIAVEDVALPLMIEVITERDRLDQQELSARLAAAAPAAVFEDHSAWRLPLSEAARAQALLAWTALALAVVALVAAAAVWGRMAVAAGSAAIGTLRLIGAHDRTIAGTIARRALRTAAAGGIAGAVLAAVLIAHVSARPAWGPAPAALTGVEWLAVPLAPALAAGLAALAARAAARMALARAG